jgi:hypothetical protein
LLGGYQYGCLEASTYQKILVQAVNSLKIFGESKQFLLLEGFEAGAGLGTAVKAELWAVKLGLEMTWEYGSRGIRVEVASIIIAILKEERLRQSLSLVL